MLSRENFIEETHKNNSNNDHRVMTSEHLTHYQTPPEVLNWIDQEGFDLITICNLKGQFTFVSGSIQTLLGYKREEIINRSVFDFLIREDKMRLLNHLKKNQNEKRFNNDTFTFRLKHTKGHYIWMETKINQIIHNGETSYISISRDISDKKEAEEILIRSEKMSVAGQLAAGIAHEIRNPITSLKGFLQLMSTGYVTKEDYYEIMSDEIEKIEKITTELLFISKPLSNDIKFESLNDMISDVCILMRSQANLSNVNINFINDHSVETLCDRSQIKQVFINIIKNAIEIMVDGGTIEITINENNKYVFVDIADEGPGIPESIIDKIYEPFFTTKKDGTGLGLMISKQILEKHQGSLVILDNEKGGCTFRIQLPIS